LASDLFNYMHDRFAAFMAGSNVKKGDFVCAFLVVTSRDFDWITGIPNLDKAYAFDDTTLVDVKAGNDAFGEAHTGFGGSNLTDQFAWV
jgi:hypothetical protein